MILTYPYWQRRFGGAENAVGQTLSIDNTPAEIIGILPASFTFMRQKPALLVPMQLDRATATGIEFDFQAIARLKPGVTLTQAQDDLTRMIPLLPAPFAKLELQQLVRPLATDVVGKIADVLWILFAAVSVVLLIACGNVANLFLIRAEGRQMELAMRTALGASRGRLARVLLAESVLLSIAGGVLGLMLAQIIIGLLRRMAPAQLPRVGDIDINLVVLLFALAISVASGTVFGLMTVVKFGRPNPVALKEGGRSSSDAPARHRTRNVLDLADAVRCAEYRRVAPQAGRMPARDIGGLGETGAASTWQAAPLALTVRSSCTRGAYRRRSTAPRRTHPAPQLSCSILVLPLSSSGSGPNNGPGNGMQLFRSRSRV